VLSLAKDSASRERRRSGTGLAGTTTFKQIVDDA